MVRLTILVLPLFFAVALLAVTVSTTARSHYGSCDVVGCR